MLEMGEGSLSMPTYNLKFLATSSSHRGDELSPASTNGVSITPIPNQPYHTPSPDSAIHSASGCYSPSQSPVQSRQVSGVSSPFSLASLSRNNSDASQSGSPNTFHLSSPHDSPVQVRHTVGQVRPLGSSRPAATSFHAQTVGGEMSISASSEAAGMEADVYGAVSTQPGISRQQLINSPCRKNIFYRCCQLKTIYLVSFN